MVELGGSPLVQTKHHEVQLTTDMVQLSSTMVEGALEAAGSTPRVEQEPELLLVPQVVPSASEQLRTNDKRCWVVVTRHIVGYRLCVFRISQVLSNVALNYRLK